MTEILATFYTPNDPWRFWLALTYLVIHLAAIAAIVYRYVSAERYLKRHPRIHEWLSKDPFASKTLTATMVVAILPSTIICALVLVANF